MSINRKAKWVLEADIAKCFDRISHDALLQKMDTFPLMRKQIRAWLKAGILDQGKKIFPEEGTPQGGVISPLLANIALHGMEIHLKNWVSTLPSRDSFGKSKSRRDRKKALSLIRYADDFVILHENEEIVKNAKGILTEWLKPLGLELKESKTRVTHTFLSIEGQQPGFDF